MSKAFNVIHTVSDLLDWLDNESEATSKIFAALTDASLKQAVADNHRTIGRMAWHLVQTIPEMSSKMGLKAAGPSDHDPVPTSAAAIKSAYDSAVASLKSEIKKNWNDETLKKEDDMYGSMWSRSFSMTILLTHEIHHRGQMTVLMRQAGLKVPGIFGPSYEEWDAYGMKPPAV